MTVSEVGYSAGQTWVGPMPNDRRLAAYRTISDILETTALEKRGLTNDERLRCQAAQVEIMESRKALVPNPALSLAFSGDPNRDAYTSEHETAFRSYLRGGAAPPVPRTGGGGSGTGALP